METKTYLVDLFGLAGRMAVVIGGTGQLCGAMAGGFAAAGAEVVIVGRDAAKAAALLLASERAGSFITGAELIVDGGFNPMSI